jgi:hypothetical protein
MYVIIAHRPTAPDPGSTGRTRRRTWRPCCGSAGRGRPGRPVTPDRLARSSASNPGILPRRRPARSRTGRAALQSGQSGREPVGPVREGHQTAVELAGAGGQPEQATAELLASRRDAFVEPWHGAGPRRRDRLCAGVERVHCRFGRSPRSSARCGAASATCCVEPLGAPSAARAAWARRPAVTASLRTSANRRRPRSRWRAPARYGLTVAGSAIGMKSRHVLRSRAWQRRGATGRAAPRRCRRRGRRRWR